MTHMTTQCSQTFQSKINILLPQKIVDPVLQVILDHPSSILFGTPNSLLLQTQLSLFQDCLPTHIKFLTATPN